MGLLEKIEMNNLLLTVFGITSLLELVLIFNILVKIYTRHTQKIYWSPSKLELLHGIIATVSVTCFVKRSHPVTLAVLTVIMEIAYNSFTGYFVYKNTEKKKPSPFVAYAWLTSMSLSGILICFMVLTFRFHSELDLVLEAAALTPLFFSIYSFAISIRADNTYLTSNQTDAIIDNDKDSHGKEGHNVVTTVCNSVKVNDVDNQTKLTTDPTGKLLYYPGKQIPDFHLLSLYLRDLPLPTPKGP